jgi:hypothetical protein
MFNTQLHPSYTEELILANWQEAVKGFKGAELANTEANLDKIKDWMRINAQHPDGKGIAPTVEKFKQCFAQLHRANQLEWLPGKSPRTAEQARAEEESKRFPIPQTRREIIEEQAAQKYVATQLAALRRTASNARGMSHTHSSRIQAGLTQLMDKFVTEHGGDVSKVTVAEADAFTKIFMAEERKLQEEARYVRS